MTEQPNQTATGGTSAEFGYYPIPFDMDTDQFSIHTLPDHQAKVAGIIRDASVFKDWIYPKAQPQRDMFTGSIRLLPFNSRTFPLPKTHVLTLHKNESQDDLIFVIWCLSFFTGMRLTTIEEGFVDATPIKPGQLVDFSLSRCNISDAIQLALKFLELERGDPLATKRITAVINALFLAQYPQCLPFEQFQYLYAALDGCFKLLEVKHKPKKKPNHKERINWMCETLHINTPEWAKRTEHSEPRLSTVRNSTIHEAIFFGEPLGFSVYGGNNNAVNDPLQMKALVCRLLVAILGREETNYVKSEVNTRMTQVLELKP